MYSIDGDWRLIQFASSSVDGLKPHHVFPGLVLRTTEVRQSYGVSYEALHNRAAALYEATSRDAETFEAGLLIPEIRLKLEAALHQKLTDQMLRRLASQAKLEALYWYKYMLGLEKVHAGSASMEQ